MKEKEKEFEELLKNYFDDLIFANQCYKQFVHLNERTKDRLEIMNYAPGFFRVTMESLFLTCIIVLCRIVEVSKKRSHFNIYTFLEFIQKNVQLFTWDEHVRRAKLNKDDINFYKHEFKEIDIIINECKILLENKKESINTLFIWRDKYYAHNDKYFLQPGELEKIFPLKYIEIKEIIDILKKILNKFYVTYCGTEQSISPFNQFDIDIILDILEEERIKRKEYYENLK